MSTRIEPHQTSITRAVTLEQMQYRLQELKQERTHHASTTEAKPGHPDTHTSGDGKAAFYTVEGLTYYERLTGHIEELEYLIAAMLPGKRT